MNIFEKIRMFFRRKNNNTPLIEEAPELQDEYFAPKKNSEESVIDFSELIVSEKEVSDKSVVFDTIDVETSKKLVEDFQKIHPRNYIIW